MGCLASSSQHSIQETLSVENLNEHNRSTTLSCDGKRKLVVETDVESKNKIVGSETRDSREEIVVSTNAINSHSRETRTSEYSPIRKSSRTNKDSLDRLSYNSRRDSKSKNEMLFESVFTRTDPVCSWDDIEFTKPFDTCVIAKSPNGYVLHGHIDVDAFKKESVTKHTISYNVAIKLISLESNLSDFISRQLELIAIRDKVLQIQLAQMKLDNENNFVPIYGLVYGQLPRSIRKTLFNQSTHDMIGIVSRYEPGGSLQSLIHPSQDNLQKHVLVVSFGDKIKFLYDICTALAKLHNAGFVHGNLRLSNVLLSCTYQFSFQPISSSSLIAGQSAKENAENKERNENKDQVAIFEFPAHLKVTTVTEDITLTPPSSPRSQLPSFHHSFYSKYTPAVPTARLSDLKLSQTEDSSMKTLNDCCLNDTESTKVLLEHCIYKAPEMMINPYEDADNSIKVCTTSTDMYAFAIVGWEILTGLVPFAEITKPALLCTALHRGKRPNIRDLPPECPDIIRDMIESCWIQAPEQRLSSNQCQEILLSCNNNF